MSADYEFIHDADRCVACGLCVAFCPQYCLEVDDNGMPKAIVAHTVKGKGVSLMENTCKWHGTAPNHDQMEEALKEIQYNA